MIHDCPDCKGEGFYDHYAGYRQYGMGYGDCEEVFEERECETCEGRRELDPDEDAELISDLKARGVRL